MTKLSSTTNVAYFDGAFVESGLVKEAGFYVVEKEAFENIVQPHTPDGKPIEGAAPISLGVVVGQHVYPDSRESVSAEEREIGWFNQPLVDEILDGGEE